MKINIKHILKGLNNSVFVKEEVEKIAKDRLEICRKCPMNSKVSAYDGIRPDEHCISCGCNLHMKTRSLDSSCPLEKWAAVASEEEDEAIRKAMSKPNNTQNNENQ